jgi:hypothetical protein
MFKTIAVHEQKALTSNQTATIQVPAGGKIHKLQLCFTTGAGAPVTEAQIRAEIGNIRLTVNGTEHVNSTAIRLLDFQEMLASNVGTPAGIGGVVELLLPALIYPDPIARDVFGLGTANVTSIQIQITAGTLATIAAVQAFSARTPVQENLGAYMSFVDYNVTFNAIGEHTLDTLPRDINTNLLFCVVDDGTAGTITFGECILNGQTLIEKYPSAVNASIISDSGMTQLAGYFIYSFNDGGLTSNLPMQGASDFRIKTTFSVAPGAAGYNVTLVKIVNFPNAAMK